MRKFRLLRFILEIKIALHNPYNKRDMALGLWVNGMYGLMVSIARFHLPLP